MRLFIAEKPNLGRAIAQGLGNQTAKDGYIECGQNDIVIWCFGHILEQAEPEEYDVKYEKWSMEDLPIIPTHWKMNIKRSSSKQFQIIKTLVHEADEIINAGDPDREGQLLVDEVLLYLKATNVPVHRILLNALDDKSVQKALHNLRDNRDFIGLRNSALARSRADWIIGMNLTRAVTIKGNAAGYDGVFSVGRVQTPTMALVVKRELERKNFTPVNYYPLQVDWQHPNGTIHSVWKPREDQDGLDDENRMIRRDVVEHLAENLKDHTGIIKSIEQKQGRTLQRLPYSLSTLQIEAGKKYGYSPQQVLDTQQELYEKKLTSYPRSDCEYLPTNQLSEASQILHHLKGISTEFAQKVVDADVNLKSKAWNDKKISAHHAIIPTTVPADFASLTDMQQKLYRMVATAYLAQFYPVQEFLSTKMTIEENVTHEQFVANGKVIIKPGWKALYTSLSSQSDADDSHKEENQPLPAVQNMDSVLVEQIDILSKQTKPPKRFTPASLIEAMKKIYKYIDDKELAAILKQKSGIGTEATRADIIEGIQKRGYVALDKKELVPTEKGYMLMKLLPDSLTSPITTAIWEYSLDAISNKEISVTDFTAQQEEMIQTILQQTIQKNIAPPRNLPTCPKCKKPLKRFRSKKNGKFYWSCFTENCGTFFDDNKGKPQLKKSAYKKKIR